MTRYLMIGLLLVLTSGCQGIKTDYHKLDLATVSGTVRLDGEPLSGAHIMYQSEDGTFSVGQTDSNGKYSMMFDSNKAGVLTGNKIVRIRLSRNFNGYVPSDFGASETEELDSNNESFSEEEVPGDQPLNAKPKQKERSSDSNELHENYHHLGKLRVVVQSGRQSIDFDLNSDGSTMGPVQ